MKGVDVIERIKVTHGPAPLVVSYAEWHAMERAMSRCASTASQYLLPLPDDSGCMRWGMCDLPTGGA